MGWRIGVSAWVFIALLAPSMAFASDGGVTDAGPVVPSSPVTAEIPAERMPKLVLTCEPKEVSVGEVAYWRLKIKRRPEDRVHLASGTSFGDLEVRSKDVIEGQPEGEWTTETLEVQLIGFTPGEFDISPKKLTVVDTMGRIAEVETDKAHITIKSLIANEPEPKLKEDEGPGEKVFEKDYTLLWILGILGGVGVVVLLTLLVRWLWSKRRPKPAPPPPPPRPAEEIAYEKLNALKGSSLLAEGEIKEFHVRLSETIREYLGNRYHFDSLERSTEELIGELRKVSLEPSEYTYVVEFLGETDLVKFAKVILTLDESNGLLEKSFEFVHKTTPKLLISQEEKEGSAKQGSKEGGDA